LQNFFWLIEFGKFELFLWYELLMLSCWVSLIIVHISFGFITKTYFKQNQNQNQTKLIMASASASMCLPLTQDTSQQFIFKIQSCWNSSIIERQNS
jgi:hypothetical protein